MIEPRNRGFTLVELLVVIVIITMLGAFGITKIRGVLIDSKKTACREQLQQMHAHLLRYENNSARGKRLPYKTKEGEVISGSDFVLAIWGDPFIERSQNNVKYFFCPSQGDELLSEDELEELDGSMIHYAGRNQAEREYRVRKTDAKGASKTIIICDKPSVDGEEAHSGQCLCVLYLNGVTGEIERDMWGEDSEMIIGEESPVEALQGLIGSEDDL